jgi:hypothetical protein
MLVRDVRPSETAVSRALCSDRALGLGMITKRVRPSENCSPFTSQTVHYPVFHCRDGFKGLYSAIPAPRRLTNSLSLLVQRDRAVRILQALKKSSPSSSAKTVQPMSQKRFSKGFFVVVPLTRMYPSAGKVSRCVFSSSQRHDFSTRG